MDKDLNIKSQSKYNKIIVVLGVISLLILTSLFGMIVISKTNSNTATSISSQSSPENISGFSPIDSKLSLKTDPANFIIAEQAPLPINNIDKSNTILQAIAQESSFSIFSKIISSSNMSASLGNKDSKYTIFIPTDRAFSKIGGSFIDSLFQPSSSTILNDLVNYHIISGIYDKSKLIIQQSVKTLQGKSINILVDQQKTIIDNSSALIYYDIPVNNGIIHVVDTVLSPE